MTRPERVVIEATDQDGNRYRKEATGLKARAIQHEIDHLDGILFLDHLSLIKRQMLLAQCRREHKDDTGYIKEVPAASRPVGVMRIVFFGTPEFAVASLRALLRERFAVAGVVTQPDSPQGRSRSTLVRPAVKQLARRPRACRCCSPCGRSATSFSPSLRRLEAELGVVVAYGHILRPEVLEPSRAGMINVHASLLPRFRGAAPIQHAILAGEPETGVSIMQMEEGLDSGPVLHRVATPDRADETGGRAHRASGRAGRRRRWSRRSRCWPPVSPVRSRRTRPARPTRPRSAGRWPGSTGPATRRPWSARCAPSTRRPARGRSLDEAPVKLFGAVPADGRGEPGTVLAAADRLVVALRRRGARGAGGAARRQEPHGGGRWVRGRGIAAGRRFE